MRKKKKIAPRKKKIAPRDFDRQFVEIGKKYLRTLPEEKREKRLAAFERAVISRSDAGSHAKFSGTSETREMPCLARTRSDPPGRKQFDN